MNLSRFAIATALRAAADALEEANETDEMPRAKTLGPPRESRTGIKAARRARKLVAPAGQADELAAQRAKQLLREHGLTEVDE